VALRYRRLSATLCCHTQEAPNGRTYCSTYCADLLLPTKGQKSSFNLFLGKGAQSITVKMPKAETKELYSRIGSTIGGVVSDKNPSSFIWDALR
jgi:hypothetical protein